MSSDPQSLIGCSAAMQRVRERIRRFARSPVPILILGETGTGKELCAEAIFHLSGYAPFVPLNCAAIPEGVAESELFGHERGAFTGAVKSRVGVVAHANGGTLFLDELAELPAALQAKLLRTLESGEYRPVGASDLRRSLFRILAATSGDLRASVAAGRLREDLLHRVSAVRIELPPLRVRLEDIPPIAADLLRRYRARAEAGPTRITPDACALLMLQPWPGNIRELRNVIEASAAAAGTADAIGVADVMECLSGTADGAAAEELLSLEQVRERAERRAILEALGRAGGNRERAAGLLRINVATLYRKLARRAATPQPSSVTEALGTCGTEARRRRRAVGDPRWSRRRSVDQNQPRPGDTRG